MNVLELNKKYLSRHYPALIRAFESTLEDEYTYTREITRSGELNLRIEINQNSYYLHSRYNARHEAKKWVESIGSEIDDIDNVLLVGIGLGYYLEELLSVTKARYIFVYEPSVLVFKEWLNERAIEKTLSDPRIRLFAVGESEFLPLQLANDISEQMIGTFRKVSPPIYERLFPEISEQFNTKMKDTIIQQISNMQTREFNQETWLENSLFNLPYLINNSSILALKDKWKDQNIKAIIVGSGPSLSQDLHYLSELKEKCLIIAAGSSIQAMEHLGVYPHFVVSMDGTKANHHVFKNVDVSRVPLVFCPSIYYEILEGHKNSLYYGKFQSDIITKYLYESQENEIPSFISTATVTGTGIQIAAFMGIKDIYLMGQDLSYPNNQFYAPGVVHISEEIQDLHIAHSEKWVKNVDGGLNRTKGSMEVLLKDIEILVKIMELQGVKIINTSKGGAVIEGTEWASMDKIAPSLLEYPSIDFEISKQIPAKTPETKDKQVKEVSTKLKKVSGETKKLELKIKKLTEVIKKLEYALSESSFNKTTERLVEIDKLWKNITQNDVFNVFYQYSLAHYINIYMRHVPEIVEAEDIFKKGRLITTHLGVLVKRMRDFSPSLISILEKATERLKALT
ncbi:hypothetical protein DFP94_10588 [Fontibacillus phaseoli]|uniref:Motility associated factor glycosyltransferase family protein n=1 Tax=Fontibacillus phaseoli TaxID=1416533 RepID=A0A369BBZ9_9BACL|nr:6-hydroxymethylpterin diphosphokinase MptE-like protein [Fontibacillus phaseoli]RCX19072.1 hypothetical protein DFP94_10588 [Fontibacillus phaseoli]